MRLFGIKILPFLPFSVQIEDFCGLKELFLLKITQLECIVNEKGTQKLMQFWLFSNKNLFLSPKKPQVQSSIDILSVNMLSSLAKCWQDNKILSRRPVADSQTIEIYFLYHGLWFIAYDHSKNDNFVRTLSLNEKFSSRKWQFLIKW